MEHLWPHRIIGDKVVIRTKDRVCETPDELLASKLFFKILRRCIRDLNRRNSELIHIFDSRVIEDKDIQLLVETLGYILKIDIDLIPKVLPGSEQFLRNRNLLNQFVEFLYNY